MSGERKYEPASILAVDDTSAVLRVLVEILGREGYRVRRADSGEAALAAVAASPPDLILLDVRMKGIDGIEVCRRLKASEDSRNIPIILMSGFTEVEEWVAGLQAGAVDYLYKPFRSEEILTRVRTHLDLKRAKAEIEQKVVSLRRTNDHLEAEIAERQQVEVELRRSLDHAERSRLALLGALEDQKRAETERERLTMAIEQAAEMVLVTDIHGAIQYVNPAFESVTGYTRAEAIGRNPSLVKSGVQDQAFYRGLWETITAGKTWRGRMVNKKKDGTLYTEESTISPVRDAAGVVTSYVAVNRDITHDLDLEAQFLQSQKMESIGRLAGGVAHDFNNCLNVIQGFTQLCLGRLREDDPLASDLGQVAKASERAAGLTRQLLAFGRKQVLQPEQINLNQTIADMEKMLRRIIGEDVDLVLVLAPNLGLVKADPGQIGQVIMNLAVNACDAMPKGGTLTIVTGNLELDAEHAARHEGIEPGHHVVVAITDSGIGMDGQTMARLFEPFFTTKEQGKGSGLGLSTAYGIVKQSGGSIFVRSEVGRGTTFEVYLRRDLSAPAATRARPRTIPRRAKGDETILVVEDEEALRRLATRLLETAGYTVLSAADGEQALITCERHAGKIDLLLTDVVMPRMSGKRLAERLATTRPTLKILYMSGYTDDAIVQHGVLDADTHFIAKPFSEADLTRKIRAVLDGGVCTSGTDWPAIEDEIEQQPLDRDALRALPQDVLARLGAAAVAANYDEIVAIVEIIARTQPDAAAALRRMADRFDYGGMQEFLI
jgi:PAS domain S-box-containing protein